MEQSKLDSLYLRTLEFFSGDPARIQHFVKVHSFAAMIGHGEHLSETVQFTLEAAAIVHDVGILPAEKKYGSSSGDLQESEGPPVAISLLSGLGFPTGVTERVAYLVGHHHTYTDIGGKDYQILIEADFLVNFYEGKTPKEQIEATGKKLFVTKTGKDILSKMFGVIIA